MVRLSLVALFGLAKLASATNSTSSSTSSTSSGNATATLQSSANTASIVLTGTSATFWNTQAMTEAGCATGVFVSMQAMAKHFDSSTCTSNAGGCTVPACKATHTNSDGFCVTPSAVSCAGGCSATWAAPAAAATGAAAQGVFTVTCSRRALEEESAEARQLSQTLTVGGTLTAKYSAVSAVAAYAAADFLTNVKAATAGCAAGTCGASYANVTALSSTMTATISAGGSTSSAIAATASGVALVASALLF